MNINSVVLLALLIMLVSCGQHEPQETLTEVNNNFVVKYDDICDGSDNINLSIRRIPRFHYLSAAELFLGENGSTFLYVNGKCEYWVKGFTPSDEVHTHSKYFWLSVYEGKLNEESVSKLISELDINNWEKLEGSNYQQESSDTIEYSLSGLEFAVATSRKEASPEGVELKNYKDSFYKEVQRLVDEGQPNKGPIRAIFLNGDDLSEEPFIYSWPESLNSYKPSSFSLTDDVYCPGDSLLFAKEDAYILREWRDEHKIRLMTLGNESRRFLGVEHEGTVLRMVFRDSLPFEQENGLVKGSYIISSDTCSVY